MRSNLLLWFWALLAALTGCVVREAAFPTVTVFSGQAEPATSVTVVRTENQPLPAHTSTRSRGTETPAITSTPASPDQGARMDFQSPPEARPHYKFDVTLDYYAHSLTVHQQVTYPNATSEQLTWIPLVVEALRYPGTFQLDNIYSEQGERILSRRDKGITLKLFLPKELEPGETLRFSLSYSLVLLDINALPQLRPYPLGYDDLQANFGDWYPFIPPFMEEKGWIAHEPAYYGDHLVYDVSDYDVIIRFSAGAENLVIAASSPAIWEDGAVHFQTEARRNFAWSVSPYYEVVNQKVTLDDGQKVEAFSYYFPYHAGAGRSVLEEMIQALMLYSQLFGSYPHASISAVQAGFIDGMEYDGLFFLGTDFYNWHREEATDFLKSLTAHETAHQWWMGLVGNDQALEPWLDEALCTYGEALFYEEYYPDALDWWWTYRVNYYEPQGWVDMSIYDAPQVSNQYRKYRDPVYLRGAEFLDELRKEMGDEAFFAVLREYSKRYAYRLADAKGFWRIVGELSDSDFQELKGAYFERTK